MPNPCTRPAQDRARTEQRDPGTRRSCDWTIATRRPPCMGWWSRAGPRRSAVTWRWRSTCPRESNGRWAWRSMETASRATASSSLPRIIPTGSAWTASIRSKQTLLAQDPRPIPHERDHTLAGGETRPADPRLGRSGTADRHRISLSAGAGSQADVCDQQLRVRAAYSFATGLEGGGRINSVTGRQSCPRMGTLYVSS